MLENDTAHQINYEYNNIQSVKEAVGEFFFYHSFDFFSLLLLIFIELLITYYHENPIPNFRPIKYVLFTYLFLLSVSFHFGYFVFLFFGHLLFVYFFKVRILQGKMGKMEI